MGEDVVSVTTIVVVEGGGEEGVSSTFSDDEFSFESIACTGGRGPVKYSHE